MKDEGFGKSVTLLKGEIKKTKDKLSGLDKKLAVLVNKHDKVFQKMLKHQPKHMKKH